MNERQLLSIGIDPHHQFLILQLILGNTLKSHINSLNPDSANEWKSQLHQIMVKHFSPHVLCFLNLQPFTRTVVLSIDPSQSLSQVKAEFGQRFIALSKELHSVYQYDITGCFGSIVSNYFQIGSSYKKPAYYKNIILLSDWDTVFSLMILDIPMNIRWSNINTSITLSPCLKINSGFKCLNY